MTKRDAMRSSDRVRPRLVRRGHDRHLQQFLFGHAPKYVFERYAKVREEGGLPIGIRWKKSDSDLNYHPQLDNSGNFASFRKWPKLLKRWWTRPGSNRRPPRCERVSSHSKQISSGLSDCLTVTGRARAGLLRPSRVTETDTKTDTAISCILRANAPKASFSTSGLRRSSP